MKKPIRRFRKDESGVASTVGTIMALLVFLTFMSLIVNQYVPVWMKDAEAAHMSGAFGQFGQFKSSVDLQILAATMAQNAGVHYIPITTFSGVSLGVDGVPIFASPTVGTLDSFPNDGAFTTQFAYDIRGVSTSVNESSAGQIVLDVLNRYYIRQRVVYENGAVIRWQNDGQVVRAEPTFEVRVVNNSVQYSWTQVSLFGRGSVAGTTMEGIHSKLLAVDRQDYNNIETDVWINVTSKYGLAWVLFANRTLSNAFGIGADRFGTCPRYCYSQVISGGVMQSIVVETPFYYLEAAWSSARQAYDVVIRLENDPGGSDPDTLRIGVFRLQHAFVNIAIADRGSEVTI